MTIDDAIQTLTDIAWNKDTLDEPDTQAAIKLGIRALKRINYDRAHYLVLNLVPLLGETPEKTEASHET